MIFCSVLHFNFLIDRFIDCFFGLTKFSFNHSTPWSHVCWLNGSLLCFGHSPFCDVFHMHDILEVNTVLVFSYLIVYLIIFYYILLGLVLIQSISIISLQ
jgi:hypothetical protein